MELKLDEKGICAQCKKEKRHVDICRAKDQSMRQQVEVEFAVCGVCGKGYCSLRADTDEHLCERCAEPAETIGLERQRLNPETVLRGGSIPPSGAT